jgi:hypothetical protein
MGSYIAGIESKEYQCSSQYYFVSQVLILEAIGDGRENHTYSGGQWVLG